MGEGDGTVSLLSLGAMCVEGWKRKRWNPAGIKVTTVEVPLRSSIYFLGAHGILPLLYPVTSQARRDSPPRWRLYSRPR